MAGADCTGAGARCGRRQLPDLIVELLKAGWDVPVVPRLDDEDDPPAVDEDEDTGPGLLDMRVLGYPDGAMIGLAVDTEVLEVATTIGASLGRHLADAAPALLGWTTDSLRATKLTSPDPSGDWLPPLRDDGPRFPVAEHLRSDLLEMAAQFLIAGAVRDLHDPTGESRYTPEAVDAADLVAGAATQHPWGREVAGDLGTLLIAAGRGEAASGTRRPLIGRGGGDTALAQQLLESVRGEIDEPTIAFDDDRMRGHVLVEEFMERHDLQWNQHNDEDPDAGERRSSDQLRALLWAGLRALATLSHDVTDHARSPWLWLTGLRIDRISPAVGVLAEIDDEHLTVADEDDTEELASAAQAHLIVRAALLYPDLLESEDFTEPWSPLSDTTVTAGPLHHIAGEALTALGSDAIQKAASTTKLRKTADLVLPSLRAIEALQEDNEDDEGDPYNDLFHALEQLLPGPRKKTNRRLRLIRDFLSLLTAAANTASETPAKIASSLTIAPAATACVLLSSDDSDRTEQRLQIHILIAAAALDPTIAGSYAADLPALRSKDPRDEPALRNQVNIWWNRVLHVIRQQPELLSDQPPCPDPGASLLKTTTDNTEPSSTLDHLTTAQAAVAVIQAISAISVAHDDPDLPAEILQ
ncbi:hypothetical protein [Amycolatopsis sp. NPDC051071]|uniref:hypothetical protein n=1 Tax=Amycolatopsis sp. NPDC051071 TaxID=3154637 RepID=UPI003435DBEC